MKESNASERAGLGKEGKIERRRRKHELKVRQRKRWECKEQSGLRK
jgi:hypothetical protein